MPKEKKASPATKATTKPKKSVQKKINKKLAQKEMTDEELIKFYEEENEKARKHDMNSLIVGAISVGIMLIGAIIFRIVAS